MEAPTLEELLAHIPENVRLVLMDDTELPVEVEFEGVDHEGIFRFSVVLPDEKDEIEFKSLLVDKWPGKTSILLPPLAGMH